MVNYCCEKCGKKFDQKSHYDSHLKKKNPCVYITKPLNEIIASEMKNVIESNNKKVKKIIKKTISKKKSLDSDSKSDSDSNSDSESNKKNDTKKPKKEERNKVNKTYKVISLFTGMGGMDIGFGNDVIVHKNSISEKQFIEKKYKIKKFCVLKKLPFEIVFQNDILQIAEKIIKLNKWDHNFVLGDIWELIKDNYIFPEADIIVGGFPCQDFSHAGKRKGFESDRGNLYKAYVDIVKKVKPVIFVAENVYGLLTMKEKPIDTIKNDFEKEGYEVKYQLIKCEEFGIPQTRWRVIIIGVRNDKICKIKKKIGDDWNIISKNKAI